MISKIKENSNDKPNISTMDLTACKKCHMYQSLYKMAVSKGKLITFGSPSVYLLESKETFKHQKHNIRKFEIGDPNLDVHDEKIIMVVGSTGSGKSTLINGMANYILGVQWEDNYRYKLIDEDSPGNSDQSESQTQWINAYTFHHDSEFQIPFSLTVIDTPGFGDTRGIARDKEITEQIKNFFTSDMTERIDRLHAIAFVVQASLPRLTHVQRYIFDSIMSLYGKDMAKNIFMLLTFADAQKPQVLSGLKAAELPYEAHFKFNNAALYASLEEDETDIMFSQMFWTMGVKSFENFFKKLAEVKAQSLVLTKQVLQERSQLEIEAQVVQEKITTGIRTLTNLYKEMQLLQKHQLQIEANKNFEITTTTMKPVLEPFMKWRFKIPWRRATNCMDCHVTCHNPCFATHGILRDTLCDAFKDGRCIVCPRGCPTESHENMSSCYKQVETKETKTFDEIKAKYQDAKGKKLSVTEVIEKEYSEFQEIQLSVIGAIDKIRMILQRLEEIALKQSPVTTTDYIDMMIQVEKKDQKEGWRNRIEHLLYIREQAEIMKKFVDQKLDPFEEMRKKIEEENAKMDINERIKINFEKSKQYWKKA